MPTPNSVTMFQSSLGMCNLLQPFIPHIQSYGHFEDPPAKAKYLPLGWVPQQKFPYHQSPQFKDNFKTTGLFQLTQTSHKAGRYQMKILRASLLQEDCLIAFTLKSLTDTKMRYAHMESEKIIMVFTCKQFHAYMYRKSFLTG